MDKTYSKNLPYGNFKVWNQYPELNSLFFLNQIHSDRIIKVNPINFKKIEADGMIIENICAPFSLCIVTADCLPILLLGEKESAFIHAGWKGIKKGIIENNIIKSINPYYAYIGPSIGSCCFEVQKDFESNFKKENFVYKDNKIFYDLKEEAYNRLMSINDNIRVEMSHICTCCSEGFHSYRRNKTILRNWNVFKVEL